MKNKNKYAERYLKPFADPNLFGSIEEWEIAFHENEIKKIKQRMATRRHRNKRKKYVQKK